MIAHIVVLTSGVTVLDEAIMLVNMASLVLLDLLDKIKISTSASSQRESFSIWRDDAIYELCRRHKIASA